MEPTSNVVVDRSLLNEAELFAKQNGLPLEQVIQLAMENGLTKLRSEHFFRSRQGLGNIAEALSILRRAGGEATPIAGDEIPEDLQ